MKALTTQNVPHLLCQIFDSLNFVELLQLKEINQYFYDFVHCNFPQRFTGLSFVSGPAYIGIDFTTNYVNFPINDLLRITWRDAFHQQIPVFIFNSSNELSNSGSELPPEGHVLIFAKGPAHRTKALRLPFLLRYINDFKLVRYWLKLILSFDFNILSFNSFIFNPEIFELLFTEEEISQMKFKCHSVFINFTHQNIDAWKFTIEHLITCSEFLSINFETINTTNRENNILINLLLNNVARIPKILFREMNANHYVLYNNLINRLKTADDLSNVVAVIKFCNPNWARPRLADRGDKLEESTNIKECYELTNDHDPGKVFEIIWLVNETNVVKDISITKIQLID